MTIVAIILLVVFVLGPIGMLIEHVADAAGDGEPWWAVAAVAVFGFFILLLFWAGD